MSDIYDPKFQNWIKGVLGIRETRLALCDFVIEKMENEIRSMSENERRHLPMFLLCLSRNGITHLKTFEKVQRRSWECNHTTCETLMDHMIELHTSPIKTECKWSFHIDKHTTMCPLLEVDQAEIDRDKEKKAVWAMIQLFMHGEKEKECERSESLDDLDISKIVKMMRNCKLFIIDDSERLYDEVIGVRNELMHSTDNQVSDEKVHAIFGLLKDFLKHINETGTTRCTRGSKYLQMLENKSFSITNQSKEYKEIARNILKIKKATLDLDKLLQERSGNNKTKTKVLKQLLEEATQQFNDDDVEDEMPTDYKQLVKSTIEIKKHAIDTDIVTPESSGKSITELQALKIHTKQQLKVVEENLSKADQEELISNLNKQVKTLSTECYDYETEIKNNNNLIEKLKTENIELQKASTTNREIARDTESESETDEFAIDNSSEQLSHFEGMNSPGESDDSIQLFYPTEGCDLEYNRDNLLPRRERIGSNSLKSEENTFEQFHLPFDFSFENSQQTEKDNISANDIIFDAKYALPRMHSFRSNMPDLEEKTFPKSPNPLRTRLFPFEHFDQAKENSFSYFRDPEISKEYESPIKASTLTKSPEKEGRPFNLMDLLDFPTNKTTSNRFSDSIIQHFSSQKVPKENKFKDRNNQDKCRTQ